MVTLPFHYSHMLQPLNVTCFKPFKTTFRKKQNVTMAKKHFFATKQNPLSKMGGQSFATIFEKRKHQTWV